MDRSHVRRLFRIECTLATVTLLASSAGAQIELPRFAPLREMMPGLPGYQLAVTSGDVDGDQDVDLVIGGSAGPRLLRNDAYGKFVEATDQLPLWTHYEDDVTSVVLGDVDGDGDLDLFAGAQNWIHEYAALDRLYLNDGHGMFVEEPGRLPGTYDRTLGVDLVDIEGDGDLDAVLANVGWYDSNRILVNDGQGYFSDESDRMPEYWSVAIGAADVDGDLDVDLLLASSLTQNPLLLNDGAGHFHLASGQVPVQTLYETAVELEDIDLDGDVDALLGSPQHEVLWLNDGSGYFANHSGAFPITSEETYSLSLADADGDLDLDVLSNGRLYINDGLSFFAPVPAGLLSSLDETDEVTMFVDVDADQDEDVVVGAAQPRLLLHGEGTHFQDVTGVLLDPPVDTTDLALGDADADGDLDLFMTGSPSSDPLVRYVNDGTGVLERIPSGLEDFGQALAGVELGDVDGDGDLDVLTIAASTSFLCRNDGGGTFECVAGALPGQPSIPEALALGDLDLDGDLDGLFVAGTQGVWVYLNDGGGSFQLGSGLFPMVSSSAHSAELADVDGDGDLDVWLSLYQDDQLFLNDGLASFTEVPQALPHVGQSTLASAIGDVDGDGDPDVVVLRFSLGLDLLHNDGSGRFQPTTGAWPDAAPGATGDIELADLDGDGDVDVVFFGGAVFVNDGLGGFAPGEVDFGNTINHLFNPQLELVDLDLDGDLDAVLGNSAQDAVRFQLERQLAQRATPRLNRPLELELHGPARGPWLLLASRAEDHVPFGETGVLRLARDQILFERSGTFDASGYARVSLDLPSDPGLEGQVLFWQALVFDPRRFTNLERTRITSL